MSGTQKWVSPTIVDSLPAGVGGQSTARLPGRTGPYASVRAAPRPTSDQDLERVAERLCKLPGVSSKQAAVGITPEVPMPDHYTSLRSSLSGRLPRSAGAALILALVLFAGGYAAGQEA